MTRSANSMKDTPSSSTTFDPLRLSQIMGEVMERAQPVIKETVERYAASLPDYPGMPEAIQKTYGDFMQALLADPQKLAKLQLEYWNSWSQIWEETLKKYSGEPAKDVFQAEKSDRRFRSPEWQDSPYFNFLRQSYLMTSAWMRKVVHSTEGLDKETVDRLDFYTRQLADAMAPTNFILTNPEVLKETIETNGENLIRGLQNLIEDFERGAGELKISTTDYAAFTLGKNIAVTPGSVVFQNELIQLIQYRPTTDKVFKRPLLVIPPWINKYYILDMRPENSYIRWLVDRGHTVFIVSWVNPSPALAKKTFDDYMRDGVLESLRQIESITGEKDANVIGYCIGGTLLSITMAYLAAHGEEGKIASATFLTTLVDFENSGDLKLFTDDAQLEKLDKEMAEKGVLSSRALQKTFSLLRANDLIWSFVINNYLLGREPFPFDLLYWNDDSTNMPAMLHSFYLRAMYRDNLLTVPGGITVSDTPIDISEIRTPTYFLSTREDHIAPWKATYQTTQMVKGPHVFTLAASGHIAGVINPPAAEKYGFWSSETTPAEPEEWLKIAREIKGSWWPHWQNWVEAFTGPMVAARDPGEGIEPAPGSYVKVKVE